jgi:hypothetical protein
MVRVPSLNGEAGTTSSVFSRVSAQINVRFAGMEVANGIMFTTTAVENGVAAQPLGIFFARIN